MKHMKRISALLLALVMVLALSAFAYAADNFTITITPNSNDNADHTYEAYQIFKGDLVEKDGKKILSNIDWGTGVNGTELLAELKTDPAFAACNSAQDVAEVLKGFGNDAADTQAFAKIVGKHLNAASGTYSSNQISGLDAGYYLVKDQNDSLSSGTTAAYTRYILDVVSDVTVNAKSEVPSVDKSITGENNTTLSANSASIGDQIPYEISSQVPDMTGYEKYFFVLNDTMSKGLTFNDDVAITIGGTPLTRDTDFTVSSSANSEGGTSIEIVLKNFIQYKTQTGAAIKVTYSATLNQDADLTQTGNVNEVELVFSNDPNHTYNGDPENPDKPGPQEPTGKTPKDKTVTYSSTVKLTKVDGETQQPLTGAKFQIAGTAMKVVVINQEIYRPDASGTWYMLTNGTYTETAPTEETASLYDSTETKYVLVNEINKDTVAEQINATGYVDENGILTFEGLNAGTYTITELVAPDGYNMLAQPIELVIGSDPTDTGCTWTATVDGDDVTVTDSLIAFNVENKSGTELPSTGGIGTKIFYIAGSLMVLAAVVLLAARKRAKME